MLKKQIFFWAYQLRIKHWVKNIFVFGPLVFAHKVFEVRSFELCILGFLIFCLLASSIYILNDLVDIEKDKKHPKKKNRPIASGQISKSVAIGVSIFLGTIGLGLSLMTNLSFFIVSLLYVLNNIAYSFVIKNKVVADVISISIGFMLRFLGGAYIINVETSRWFLICAFSLSLFLALGKRRTELQTLGEEARHSRLVFETYTKEMINTAMASTCAMATVTYMLFVSDPVTIEKHKTEKFIYTIPIVAYCLIRYMLKVQEGKGTGPVEILLKDKGFIIAGVCWIIISFCLLYFF